MAFLLTYPTLSTYDDFYDEWAWRGHHSNDKSHANPDLNKKFDLLQEENIKLRNELNNLSSMIKKNF